GEYPGRPVYRPYSGVAGTARLHSAQAVRYGAEFSLSDGLERYNSILHATCSTLLEVSWCIQAVLVYCECSSSSCSFSLHRHSPSRPVTSSAASSTTAAACSRA